MGSNRIAVQMEYFKSTPGTHVYKALGNGGDSIPTLYIKKAKLPTQIPTVIKLEVTWS